MAMSIREQFTRIRDGDRFWYKNRYLPEHVRKFPPLSAIIKTVFPEEEMENFPDDPFLSGTIMKKKKCAPMTRSRLCRCLSKFQQASGKKKVS